MRLNKDEKRRRTVYVQVRDATRDPEGKIRSQSITVYDAPVDRVVALIKKAIRSAA